MVVKLALVPLAGAALVAACAAVPAPAGAGSNGAAEPTSVLIGEQIVRREWARAENRAACAPLALADDGGAGGVPRRANFGGGWAVAFDRPGLRSAYGIAGTGLLPEDELPADAQRRRLEAQWPHFRELPDLPAPSFAGYGAEGAEAYPADNPAGAGLNSLAYVRIDGQACTYNVWSRLGRAHLETLLGNLRLVPR